MNPMKHTLIALSLLGTLYGCSSTKIDADVPVETRPTAAPVRASTGAATAPRSPARHDRRRPPPARRSRPSPRWT